MRQLSNHNKFYELFVDQLREMYSAEEQIIHHLPKIMTAVSSPELKRALKKHLTETERQKEKLDIAFAELDEDPEGPFCIAMQGLCKETLEILRKKPSIVQDAAVIATVQKIEHYEIASYGTLKAFAHHLDLQAVEEIIDEILDEEKHADSTLTKIAEGSWISSGINAQAVS